MDNIFSFTTGRGIGIVNVKNGWKRGLSLGLSALLAVLILAGSLGSTYEVASAASPFVDVTGQVDFSQLMQKYFGSSVMTGSQVKQYERRTVLVSLKEESLIDAANGENVSDYAASDEGKAKTEELYEKQDELLEAIRDAGIECSLESRYVAIDNAIAIEVNTQYVSTIRQMTGVDSVVIMRSYAAPKTVEDTGSGDAVTNTTKVYGTGVYDSSGAVKDGLDGSGMLVAILDTGLDYTHAAFLNMPNGQNENRYSYDDIVKLLADKELSAEKLQAEEGGLLSASDVFVNDKVPFAYDYADHDADVYPSYSNHGTHVAGIVAGYDPSGYTDKDGNHVDEAFIGVAPEAQLMICKVFTDDLEDPDLGGADTEDILAALEDCVLLGVDVINMSLGTTCGFSTTDDGDDEGEYLNKVYTAIGEQGINLLCAASNDYSSAYGGVFGTNLSSNPDSGTVGAPATYSSALSVASISGKKSSYLLGNGSLPVFFENSNDGNSNPFDFIQQMLGDDLDSKELEYVVVPGVGLASDYTANVQELVKGRIALVKRGNSTFQEKVEIAQSFGAIGIIVYNNVAGTVRMSLGEVEDPIPAISVDMDSGEALVAAAVGRVGTVKLDKSYQAGPFMSDFSSWGSTPDLKLKPEITAHGGEITSAVPGGYTEMSGTSMACPNMAGVTALVRSYVKTNWQKWWDEEPTAVELTRLVNQIMMSTATTVYDQDGLAYSPRKQGAGLGSLDNVLTTGAYLWTDNASIDYRPKVELGDDPDKVGVYTLKFNVTNFSASTMSFQAQSLFMTETLALGGLAVAEQAHMLTDVEAQWKLNGATIKEGETFTVGAGTTAELTVVLTLSEAEKEYIDESFENGMYVEGFAKLLSVNNGDEQCDLVLPFMGFYGDWTDAPMLDYSAYEIAQFKQDSSIPDDEKPQASAWATQPYITYYNDEYVIPMGSFLYTQDENADQIYASEEHNAISCYNQYFGENSINNYLSAYKFKGLYAGLLRNARKVEYELVNTNTGEVLTTQEAFRIGKSYASGGSYRPAYLELELDPLEYDMASGEQYTMNFKFYLDYGDEDSHYDEDGNFKEENIFSFTFYVDYEAPILEDVRVRYYDYKDGNKTKQRIYLDLDVYDNLYAQSVMLTYLEDGELKLATDYVTPVYNANKNGTTTVSIEITDLYDDYKDSLYVQVDDYALNHSVYWLNLSECNQTLAPDYFELAEGEDAIELDIYGTHTVKLNYEGDGNISNFKWSSSNRSVAEVKNGEIVGLAAGTAQITVEGSGGIRETIQVTVRDNEAALPKPTISFGLIYDGDGVPSKAQGSVNTYPGKSFQLELASDPWYYPLDRLSIKWESTNPDVATVDQEGNVLTVKKGTAVIKAIIMENGAPTAYTATVTLKVQDPFEVSGYSLIKYHGGGGTVTIPTDKNIMMIGEEAFKDCEDITEVIIPKTVTSIGKNAFENCTSLKSVYFVDKEAQAIADADVNIIYQQAFVGCTSLELFDLSNVKVLTLGRECFSGCTSLKEIRRMDKIGTAYDHAFAGCTSLTSLDISGLQVCGTGTFAGCTGVTEIKTGWATQLGDYVFSGCTGLTELTLHTPRIGSYAFDGCSNLRSVTLQPLEGKTLTAGIGDHAFAGCSSLTSFVCKDGSGVLSFGDYAFANTGLSSFTVPDGVAVWGTGVLSGSAVTEIVIGDSFDLSAVRLTGIPFDQMSVVLAEDCTSYKLQDGVLYTADMTKLLLVWPSTTTVTIPASVTAIGDYAFAGSHVTSLTIPATVTEIGASAFADSDLSEIIFESATSRSRAGGAEAGLTAIPDSAFAGSKLAVVTVPASVKSIGANAFANSNLTTITFLGNAVESIGDGAFTGCTRLTEILLPDGVSTMGESVFQDCTALTTVTLPSVKTLGEYTFFGCTALTTVRFGENAETTGDFTFYRCEALTDVTLGKATTQIGEDVFFGCTALASIDLQNVTEIGDEAFAGCTALGTVTGLERVVTVGDMAFYNNNSLKKLNLTAATHIGKGAFAVENGGTAYTELSIPSAVEIGVLAFAGGKETTVTIPKTLEKLGYGAFSSSRKLTGFVVENGSKSFFTDDYGVLYNKLSTGTGNAYELCAFPGGTSEMGETYTVLDGTTIIGSYAVCGLGKQAPSKVILPWSVKLIGVSAFYDSGIRDYTFNSIKAPTLSCVYRDDVVEIMEAAEGNSTADNSAVNSLFYANFDTLMVYYISMVGHTSDLIMHIPENGTGYDNYVYSTYFGTVESLGVLMDDTTRAAITAIEGLESAETVAGWSAWEVNPENTAKLTAFSDRVKEARRLYGNITGEAQLAFVSAEQISKLEAVETALRSLKKLFNIPVNISDITPNDGYKKDYIEGDSFDMTGLVLTIVYDDGSTEPADMSRVTLVYPTEPLTRYDAVVRFEYRYGDGDDEVKTVSLTVNVTGDNGGSTPGGEIETEPETGLNASETGTTSGDDEGDFDATALVAILLIAGAVLIVGGIVAVSILSRRERRGHEIAPYLKRIAGAAIALGVIALIAGAILSADDDEDSVLPAEQVSIYYNANGGQFENHKSEKTIVYTPGSLALNIGNQSMDKGNATIERDGHVFDGWYLPQTDSAGNLLYEDADKTTVKLGQAYDFSRRMELGGDVQLYAKWRKDKSVQVILRGTDITDTAGTTYAEGSVLVEQAFQDGAVQKISLTSRIKTGKSYTFVAYYADEACTQGVEWPLTETEADTVQIYAQYVVGNWKIVSDKKSAKSMLEGLAGGGQFWLTTDIDMGGDTLSVLSSVDAVIEGNGHTISNFKVSRMSVGAEGSALLGTLKAGTAIHDLTLSGVELTMNVKPNVMTQLYFLCTDTAGADLSGLTVRGSMIVNCATGATVTNLQEGAEEPWLLGGDQTLLDDGKVKVEADYTVNH